MGQMILTTKTSASLKKQLLTRLEVENQLVETELKIKKNPERYLSKRIGFVPDHLEFGCEEGVTIFKVSVPPLESFFAVRMPLRQEVSQSESMTTFSAPEFLKKVVGVERVSFLTAADLQHSGFVDRVYVADQDHLWTIEFKDNVPQSHLLAEVTGLNALRVVPDAEGEGVRLYFLAKQKEQKGLFMIHDRLNNLKQEMICIRDGDYNALLVRFGRLLLIPQDTSRLPEVIDLPSHVSMEGQKANCSNWIVSYQLNSLLACIEADKIGRQSWRKIKNSH
jgi:hypothetical protein